MRFALITLAVCLCVITVIEAKTSRKGKQPKRAASVGEAKGPCVSGKCTDPTLVCQTSDNNCYAKDAKGLDAGDKDCKDKNVQGRPSDCLQPQIKNLCDNPVYFQLMTEQCPVACKRGCAAKKNN